jgi:general L-amino acid transport system permease protein
VSSLHGFVDGLRARLASSWWSLVLSIGSLWILFHVVSALYRWGVRDAAFGTTPAACEGATGACWAVIGSFWRIFLVGLYPEEERWRAFLALGVVGLVACGLALSRVRSMRRFPLAAAALVVSAFVLVRGGIPGLPVVETRYWGGLLITIGLSSFGLGVGIPCGILLALGRRSTDYPVIRAGSVAFIELVRSVPFILVLIFGSILLPMCLPPEWDVDLLLRAQIAVILSAAANSAEIVRGGMAAIGKGQTEAADALGLSYWQAMGFVVLPQAVRTMVPVFVSMFIIFLKDTSLVVVVGLTDLLGAARLATGNPDWIGRTMETYVFAGALYFLMCYTISRSSRKLELVTGQERVR